MRVQIPFWYPVFISMGYMPRSGIAGSYGRSIFKFFEESPFCFPRGCASLSSHQQCTRVPFFHIFANTCYFLSFWWWPFWMVWSGMSVWFSFAFSWWFVMLSTFSHARWPLVYLLWKNVYVVPLPIFNQIVLCCYWVTWVLYMSWLLSFISNMICKYFLPFHRLPFHFVDGFVLFLLCRSF